VDDELFRANQFCLMKKIASIAAIGLAALVLKAGEPAAPKAESILQTSPGSFVGKTGRPLGSICSIEGVVTKTGSNWVELSVNDGKPQHFRCGLHPQPNPPRLPRVGSTVRLTGFESVVQIGHDFSVGQYLAIRKEVLEAAGAEKRDPSGGPGALRFDTQFSILEVTLIQEAPLKSGDGQWDVQIPRFPASR
jgi:hypothetical protein